MSISVAMLSMAVAVSQGNEPELDNVIVSGSRSVERVASIPASINLLDQQSIAESLKTSPEVQQMLSIKVPGFSPAKASTSNSGFKLRGRSALILIDGVPQSTPLRNGSLGLRTIDPAALQRIEVIKGPGGSLWGANAVNGVINIITKHAKASQGGLVSALAGNEERGKLSTRYGGEINQDTHYRIYAKGFEKDEAGEGVDDWRMGRVGVRVDSEPSNKDKLTLQSDVYAGEEGERAISTITTPPFGTFASKTDVFGGNVLFRWQRDLGENSDLTIQSYYDLTEREHFYIKDHRETVDIDLQHRFQTFWQQEIIWGIGFRYIEDETKAGKLLAFSPQRRSDQIYSGFVQDEISLIDDELILTLGSKFEHNSYTGFEYQPSARLLWKFYDQHSLWGSISRAVKVPNRMEHDATIQRTRAAGGTLALNILGSQNMDAEELTAYEIGYRYLDKQFTFDTSFYYNDYQNLRSLEQAAVINGVFPLIIDNKIEGEVYGIEVAVSWQLMQAWRIHTGYSYTQMQLHLKNSSTDITEEADEGDTPHHQTTIRSLWQVSEDWQLDGALRYVDMIKAGRGKEAVKSYTTIDLRVAWQAHEAVEFSLVGQNLFGKHQEFRGSTVETQATDVEPSVYFQTDLHF